jgi:hypothetical protein
MTVVGYGKLCRSWSLSPGSGTTGNGDIEVQNVLHRLATRHPDVEFRIVGRNSGESPQSVGYPANVTNPWARGGRIMETVRAREKGRPCPLTPETIMGMCDDLEQISLPAFIGLDQMVYWAGHHGTSNSPLPPKRTAAGDLTRPYDNFVLYGSYMLRNLNSWRDIDPMNRREIWLCADARNYLKARDIKWPLIDPILGQRKQERETRYYRYGDPRRPSDFGYRGIEEDGVNWVGKVPYEYSAIELGTTSAPAAIPLNRDWGPRYDFGILLNENRKDVKNSRLDVLMEWVLPLWPTCEIFGKWADESKAKMGRPDIRQCPYEFVNVIHNRWRCTLTTPASGSGWATAKPWECFAAGTVCFFHPKYDDQNNILSDAPKELQDWLRVESPEQLKKRVDYLGQNESAWHWIIDAQRAHFEQRYEETHGGIIAIEKRLGLL